MDQAQMAATFTALVAFKRQRINLTGNRVCYSYTLTSPERDTVIPGKKSGNRAFSFDFFCKKTRIYAGKHISNPAVKEDRSIITHDIMRKLRDVSVRFKSDPVP